MTADITVSSINVVKTFITPGETIRAVNQVTVEARRGELVCIYGASGSGKSTFLSLLAGLMLPDSGTIAIKDDKISSSSVAERAALRLSVMGVVFQHDNLIEEFTVSENVAFPLELRGWSRTTIGEEVEGRLSTVGMAGYGRRRADQLSGGQQQRVGIARALAGSRDVLLADEPTGALDSKNSESLFQLLRQLCDHGVTTIMASHDPIARAYATRSLKMEDGRIVEEGED